MVIQSATTDNSYLDNKKLDAIFLIFRLVSEFFYKKAKIQKFWKKSYFDPLHVIR